MIQLNKTGGALLLVALGFVAWLALGWMTFERASWLQAYLGYWFCLVATGVAVFCLMRVSRFRRDQENRGRRGAFRKDWGIALVIAALGTYFVFLHWPMEMRVFNDEPGHALVAKSMAQERQVTVANRANFEGGTIVYSDPFPVYRLYYYSFLVSLLHNATGERLLNLYLINGAATFGVFLLAFPLGRSFSGHTGGGFLGQVLLISTPLIGYVASSANYDLLNLFLLCAFLLACLHYVDCGGRRALDLAISVGVLLAYTRSESILYLFVLVVAFLYRTWRERSFDLSLYAALSPVFLLVPIAGRGLGAELSRRIPQLYGERMTAFFDLSYIPGNATQVLQWFLSVDPVDLNSVLLSALGLVSLFALPWLIYKNRNPQPEISRNASCTACYDGMLLAWIVILFGYMLLLLSHFWELTDPSALRFFLPFFLLITMVILRFAGWLESQFPRRILPVLLIACVFYFWLWALPKGSRNAMADKSVTANYAHTSLDWIRKHDDGRTLYAAKSTYYFILHGYPAVTIRELSQNSDKLQAILDQGLYDRILILDIKYLDPNTQDWEQPRPQMPLSGAIQTKEIDAWRGYLYAITTVEEVVAVDGVPLLDVQPIRDGGGSRVFNTTREYFEYIRSLHL